MRGRILQNEKLDCTKRLKDFRGSWAQTRCIVMSNGRTDQKGRTLINFLVSCPKGTMFIKSVHASAQIKDARTLCDLLDVFILEVGAENVVQVITDNAANYVVADRMLMDRHPTLFWTPCAAHCIDLMLEDVRKIPFVKDIVESSKSITKFIYNHTSVLILMRRFTNNKELGVCVVTEPLVKVLRLVDGEKPAMGYLYEAMDRAIHRPIHAAGIFLNPAFSYACGFIFDAKIMDGFLTCAQRMVRSPAKHTEISKEIETHRMARDTFGFDMVVIDRTIKMPDIF
eukprot:PITA_12389